MRPVTMKLKRKVGKCHDGTLSSSQTKNQPPMNLPKSVESVMRRVLDGDCTSDVINYLRRMSLEVNELIKLLEPNDNQTKVTSKKLIHEQIHIRLTKC